LISFWILAFSVLRLEYGKFIGRMPRRWTKNDDKSRCTKSNLNTMRVVWFNAYTVLTVGTIALSTSLKGLGVSGNSYYAAPGTVVCPFGCK
jgi:hypothetical protein